MYMYTYIYTCTHMNAYLYILKRRKRMRAREQGERAPQYCSTARTKEGERESAETPAKHKTKSNPNPALIDRTRIDPPINMERRAQAHSGKREPECHSGKREAKGPGGPQGPGPRGSRGAYAHEYTQKFIFKH